MALKRVQSYQTTDNQLFPTKDEALTHQLKIDLRGLMQSNNIGKQAAPISVTDISCFIAAHAEEVRLVLLKYKEAMRHAAA